MARFLQNRSKLKGRYPGEMVFVGHQRMDEVEMQTIVYDAETVDETTTLSIVDFGSNLIEKKVNWLNIHGLHETDILRQLRETFDLHPLTVDDLLNTDQRPRLIDDGSHLVVIAKALNFSEATNHFKADQIGFVLGHNYLITIQEHKGNHFADVRTRIKTANGRIRKKGADYLFYALLDSIIDQHIILIEKLGEKIENNEKLLFRKPHERLVQALYAYKTEINFLRKSVRPVREIILSLIKNDSGLLSPELMPYLHDLDDLASQVNESVELYHNMINDQLNMYNAFLQNRGNDIMKTLTIYSAIFIPLTFIAGVYGTNFDNLPELHLKFGYYIMLGAMAAIAIGMLIYFRRKRWM